MFETAKAFLIPDKGFISVGSAIFTMISRHDNSLESSQYGRVSPINNPSTHFDIQALLHSATNTGTYVGTFMC